MLLRDLLVTPLGSIGPTGSSSRVEAADEAQNSLQIVTSTPTKAKPSTMSDIQGASFLDKAYQQTGYTSPVDIPPAEEPIEELVVSPVDIPSPREPIVSIPMSLHADTLAAEAGRVTTIQPKGNSDEIASIRILSQSSHGHVSVNPDNSLSLILSEEPKNQADTEFRYEITYKNGGFQEVQAKVDVIAGQEPEGWGQGDFYMLETGSDGRVVVEHGENHRKVYVTEGAHGLTRAEIAKAEGIPVSQVTGNWLKDHLQYGATPDKALDTELGMELWYATTGHHVAPNSNWLLFERGYEYEDLGRIVSRGATGESALNPMYVGAYGEGDDPLIKGTIHIFQDQVKHIVIQDINTTHIRGLLGENLLFDHIGVTLDGLVMENVQNFTMVNSDIIDVARLSSVHGGETWEPFGNRISGAYLSSIDGTLLEGNLFDHSGWAEGFDPNLSTSSPMPPSKFSHNLYVQNDNMDVTVRDNIFMRGSSFGAQVRPGGVIENNAFIDNNAALNFFSGMNYTLLLDNVVTSAGYQKIAKPDGALSMGIGNYGKQTSLIDNIIAHLANPNDPAEQAVKTVTHPPLSDETAHVNDTIIHNWGKKPSLNTEALSASVLDQTTIQNFAAQLLGKKTATIGDLANHLRAQADGRLGGTVDADVINAFFRKGFDLDTTLRAEAEVLRFVPDERADGIRWDNRLNWSTEDLPGTQDGDSIDLGGNRVLFGAETATIDDFIFGDFGQLKATSGRLDIKGEISTAGTGNLLQIDNAGQIWLDGYRDSDLFQIEMAGGRFTNTGAFTGNAEIDVIQDAQLLLATAGGRFDLAGGSSLTISGGKTKVGFDGGDGKIATLHLHDDAALAFVADATGLGKISEFHSGAFEVSNVTSGVRLGGDLTIDLSALDAKAGGAWTLVNADQVIGSFDSIAVTGLGSNQDALIQIDYAEDEVVLLVSDTGTGSGQINSSSNGEADFIGHSQNATLNALWENLQAAMPQVTDDPL